MRNRAIPLILVFLGTAAVVNVSDSSSSRQESMARGEQIYHTLCWACHGKYGRGDGPLTPNLVTSPTDLTISLLISEGSADQFLERLKPRRGVEAHTPMVLGRVLTEASLLDLVAYLKSLSSHGAGASVAAGRDLYEGICWVCHGIDGDGKGPAAQSLVGAVPRDFTSPDFEIEGRREKVFAIISLGAADTIHGSKYMATWGDNFSPQQIRDIIAYLFTFQDTNKQR